MYLVPVLNYWTWTKTIPQKSSFFWSNPYKIEVMITSLKKCYSYQTLVTWSNLQFESRDKILLVTSSTVIMTSHPLFQNTVILRRPGVAMFADIIKIISRFIKKILTTQEKLKELKVRYQNGIYICISWYKICWLLV